MDKLASFSDISKHLLHLFLIMVLIFFLSLPRSRHQKNGVKKFTQRSVKQRIGAGLLISQDMCRLKSHYSRSEHYSLQRNEVNFSYFSAALIFLWLLSLYQDKESDKRARAVGLMFSNETVRITSGLALWRLKLKQSSDVCY